MKGSLSSYPEEQDAMYSVTFDYGDKTLTLSASDPRSWSNGDLELVFYKVAGCSFDCTIYRFYEIVSGKTYNYDYIVQSNGRTFAYHPGVYQSKAERDITEMAAQKLADKITNFE